MKGFALEVKLIQWSCKCLAHVNGICHNPQTSKSEVLRESYIGSFGNNTPTKQDALDKFQACIDTDFQPPFYPVLK